MAVKAYVLVEATIGKIAAAAERIRTIPGVLSADVVAGPYDIIALLEADTADDIGQRVMAQVHEIPGIHYTMTCVVIGE